MIGRCLTGCIVSVGSVAQDEGKQAKVASDSTGRGLALGSDKQHKQPNFQRQL